jgi:hypothetical protein
MKIAMDSIFLFVLVVVVLMIVLETVIVAIGFIAGTMGERKEDK